MLEFGKLNIEEKTFTRKESKPHGQAYDGIKFRKYKSEKNKVEETRDKFIISDKAFDKLNLETLALAQASFGGQVYLLVVEDQDKVKPEATMVRVRSKQDGTKLKKGKTFTSEFLVEELIKASILVGDHLGNQYLSLTDVTSEVTELPEVVKQIFTVAIDTTVNAEDDKEETEVSESAATENF